MSRHDHPKPPDPRQMCRKVDLARWAMLLRLRDEGMPRNAIAREMGVRTGTVRSMLDRVENRLCSGAIERRADGVLEWSREYAAALDLHGSQRARGGAGLRGPDGKSRGPSDRGISAEFDLDRAGRALRLAEEGGGSGTIARNLGIGETTAGLLVRGTSYYLDKGWLVREPSGELRIAADAPRVRRGESNSGRFGEYSVLPPPRKPPAGSVIDFGLAERVLAARLGGARWEAMARALGRSRSRLHRICAMALYVRPEMASMPSAMPDGPLPILGPQSQPAATPGGTGEPPTASRPGMLGRLRRVLWPSSPRQGRAA